MAFYAMGRFPVSLPDYTITYNANGFTVGKSSEIVTRGQSVTLPTISKSGFMNFGWWTAASGGTKIGNPGDSFSPLKSQTIYARGDVSACTVTFDSRGGSAVSPIQTNWGSTVTLPSASLSGYSFDGWFTAAEGGTQVASPYTVTGNVTLYAHWTVLLTWTITFDANGGSAVSPITVTRGVSAKLPDAKKSSTAAKTFTLEGWYTAKTGGTKVGSKDSSYTPSGDVTLYAHWTETIRQYTVKFYGYNASNHTFSLNGTVKTAYNTSVSSANFDNDQLDSKFYTRGWYSAQTGGSYKAAIGGSVRVTSDMTLYERYEIATNSLDQITLTASSASAWLAGEIAISKLVKGKIRITFLETPYKTGATLVATASGDVVIGTTKTNMSFTNRDVSELIPGQVYYTQETAYATASSKTVGVSIFYERSTSSTSGITIRAEFISAIPRRKIKQLNTKK